MLGVKSETQLENVCKRLEKQGIRFASFREPDIGDQLTSVCTESVSQEQRAIFRKFQLLKEDISKVYAVYYSDGCGGYSTHFVRANDDESAKKHVLEYWGEDTVFVPPKGKFYASPVCCKIGDVSR